MFVSLLLPEKYTIDLLPVTIDAGDLDMTLISPDKVKVRTSGGDIITHGNMKTTVKGEGGVSIDDSHIKISMCHLQLLSHL
jgi:hypothetical protein